ncbi:urease accessory protein UreF [Dactylosporangium sucinum]|uniref:Urease accessory protein UreF n=2 Tax=Dactylosporangium sucinum TaxID=1424081 RepID=A0A917TNU1_9ACTN|nr:urease accessory protein UreF [Dactylosporangium sucinum]
MIPELMRVLQFTDSMFPVGAFSFSNALEPAVQHGVVHDRSTLEEFVRTATHVAAGTDGIALLESHRATRAGDADRVRRADEAVYARKLNEEMRTMTTRMGRKLVEGAAAVVADPVLTRHAGEIAAGTVPGTYPVGAGVLFAVLGLPEEAAFAAHQYGTAAMILGAAVRLMPIHHLDAQTVLFAVNATAHRHYERVAAATIEDMSSFAPVTDVLAAAHVRAHVRMFIN